MSLVQFEIDVVFLNLINTSDNNDYRTLLVDWTKARLGYLLPDMDDLRTGCAGG